MFSVNVVNEVRFGCLFMSSRQEGGADSKRFHALENVLYEAVSSASSWLDGAENELISGPMLLSDDSETHLGHLEVRQAFNIVF